MTPHQIMAVQHSFDRAFPHMAAISETFYDHLFTIAPASRPLFPEDMTDQRLKLSDTLAYTARNLTRPEVVEETIRSLARRHVRYGAKPEHFAPVGVALIHALQTHTPEGLSEFEANAWLDAYTWIADQMIEVFQKAA